MNVSLREWSLEDAQQLVYLCKAKSLRDRWDSAYAYPYNLSQAKKCIAFYQSANPLRFRIYAILLSNMVCGYVQVEVKGNSSAEISYWLGEVYRGMNIMTQAVQLACQNGFQAFFIHTIYARVEYTNLPSQYVLLKNKFIECKEMTPIYMYFLHKI